MEEGDRMENTVAGSPTNQSMDEGMWAWLEEAVQGRSLQSLCHHGCQARLRLPRGDVIVNRCKTL